MSAALLNVVPGCLGSVGAVSGNLIAANTGGSRSDVNVATALGFTAGLLAVALLFWQLKRHKGPFVPWH